MTAAAFILANAPAALACACCAQTAWRYVETEKISPQRLAEIDQMRFSKVAKLRIGVADDESIKGVEDAGESYQLDVSRQKDRQVFSFSDEKGRTGTLALAAPKTISIFEVDPRGAEKDSGLGPNLYKEWKMTANAAGDGLFRGSVGAGQKMTLVLHGRGNACSSADHFTDWTLLVYGPAGAFTMYGALDSARQ
jgi:hypothetical protein